MSLPFAAHLHQSEFQFHKSEIEFNIYAIEFHKSKIGVHPNYYCLLYTSPSPRDKRQSRMPSSA